jgi:16S rRNA (adenine1518-N6/adenine1519-N6)-dimethyltransferase
MKPPPIRKSLGQHFLNDRRILERIADALDVNGEETLIEIGPGRGSLTDVLAPRVRRLILIEYDRALAALLREKYGTRPAVEVIEADVLTVDLGKVAAGPYRLVGNVPYYITTPILFHALNPPRPDVAVYLVQREVADRISASPGSKEYGALSVNVQAMATTKTLFRVAPGSFHPPPKVESAVVRITPRAESVVAPAEEDAFRRFVIDAFSMRRKQIQRIIRALWNLTPEEAEGVLSNASIDRSARPETLAPEDFARLLRAGGKALILDPQPSTLIRDSSTQSSTPRAPSPC